MNFKLLFFAVGMVLTTILALIPTSSYPYAFHFDDKAQHALAFAALAMAGSLAFPRKEKPVYLGLMMYGVFIEITQRTLATSHVADILDVVADGVGVLIGFAAYAVLVKLQAQFVVPKKNPARIFRR